MVNFSLQFRQFSDKLIQALFGWFVELAEALRRNMPFDIQLVGAGHFVADFLNFGPVGKQ